MQHVCLSLLCLWHYSTTSNQDENFQEEQILSYAHLVYSAAVLQHFYWKDETLSKSLIYQQTPIRSSMRETQRAPVLRSYGENIRWYENAFVFFAKAKQNSFVIVHQSHKTNPFFIGSMPEMDWKGLDRVDEQTPYFSWHNLTPSVVKVSRNGHRGTLSFRRSSVLFNICWRASQWSQTVSHCLSRLWHPASCLLGQQKFSHNFMNIEWFANERKVQRKAHVCQSPATWDPTWRLEFALSLLPYIHAPYFQLNDSNEYRLGNRSIPDIISSPLL